MKKVMILALVLGFASLASATLETNVKLDHVYGSGVLDVDAWGTWAAEVDYDFGVKLTGVTLVSSANVNTTSLSSIIDQDSNGSHIGPPWMAFSDIFGSTGVAGGATNFTTNPIVFAAPSELWRMIFTGTGTAQILPFGISRSPGATEEIYDFPIIAISSVPEPMTMCLLGLGGLFLRRRR